MTELRITNRLASDLDYVIERTEPLWQELRGQRILITGATGFFGCWLLESFAWANRRLHLDASLVGLCRHPAALGEKAPHLAQDPAITLHAADIRHGDFPHGTFSHVIHAATEASATLNRESPLVMFDTIVEGTRRALRFSIASSVSKFLLVSSGAVYGTQPPHLTHIDETFTGGPDPLNPASAYAEGKRSAELLCALAASPRLAIKIARCFAFVGPYMQLDAHFAIGNFISDAMQSRPLLVKGDGSPFRSYLYASDLAVWLWTILFRGESLRAYNVGSEASVNIASLAAEVTRVLSPGRSIDIASAATPAAPAHRYVPSTARGRVELGLRAEVPLSEAIRRTAIWFEQKISTADGIAARGAHA
ncbi:MAG: NAD-dependent epimerase/dehydratase family protein [Terriglobales bacterium]